ncbi:MAG: CBS domain-containing protein [Candidatus Portnoybacteria bacterium]|nr:CBS domain-containing protein [Candidatus Portnoybacteria bacterium]
MDDQLKVKDIMTKEVVTFSPDMPISEAANVLVTRNFTGAPVMEDARLVGIVTEADFLTRGEAIHLPTFLHLFSQVKVFRKDEARFKQEFYKFLNTKVKDIMTKEVITVEPETNVEELARMFTAKRINPIPVVSQGKLAGIVSRSDIVKIFQI